MSAVAKRTRPSGVRTAPVRQAEPIMAADEEHDQALSNADQVQRSSVGAAQDTSEPTPLLDAMEASSQDAEGQVGSTEVAPAEEGVEAPKEEGEEEEAEAEMAVEGESVEQSGEEVEVIDEGLQMSVQVAEPVADVASTKDFATKTLDSAGSAIRTASMTTDLIEQAPSFLPDAPGKEVVPWFSDLVPDEVDLSPESLMEVSEGGEMVVSMGVEPAFDLVDTLDPTTRFAQIGQAGEVGLSEAQDVLWGAVTDLPGPSLVEGIDLDVSFDVEVPGLDAVDAQSVLDSIGQQLPEIAELDDTALDLVADAQALQTDLVDEGRDTILNAQAEALSFGQNTLDDGKSLLLDQQLIDHQALGDSVSDGRDAVHDMWGSASDEAVGMVDEAESTAAGIRDFFEDLIDDLPSIPFIGRVIDRIIDKMVDKIVDMFDDVQSDITSAFDDVWAEATALVDDVRTLAEDGYNAFETKVVDEVVTFATETVPSTVEDVGELAEDVAEDVGDRAVDIGSDLQDGLGDAVEVAGDGLSVSVGWIEDAGGDVVGYLEEAGPEVLAWVEEAGSDAGDWIVQTGGDVLEIAASVPVAIWEQYLEMCAVLEDDWTAIFSAEFVEDAFWSYMHASAVGVDAVGISDYDGEFDPYAQEQEEGSDGPEVSPAMVAARS